MWAPDGPLRLARATCLQCGHRFASWEEFRRHRTGICPGGEMGTKPPEGSEEPEGQEELDNETGGVG